MPSRELPLLPPVSLSLSAVRQLDECERRWWLSHVGAWRGWDRDATDVSDEARLCYRLKHLRDLPQALGIAVHQQAERIAISWRDGGRGIPEERVLAELRGELNRLYTRPRAAFIAKPKLGMLRQHYYQLPISPAVIEEVRTRMTAAAARLSTAPLYTDLGSCHPADVLVVDALEQVPLFVEPEVGQRIGTRAQRSDGGSSYEVAIYGRPDVLYLERGSLVVDGVRVRAGDSGIPVVVELKTSAAAAGSLEVRKQLATMALVAQSRGVKPHPVVHYVGRVVDVSPSGPIDDPLVSITPDEIEAARSSLHAAAARLAAMDQDEQGVIRRDATSVAHDRERTCARCSFRAVCEPESLGAAEHGAAVLGSPPAPANADMPTCR